MTIWEFNARLTRWLCMWAAVSGLLSLPMLGGARFWRGAGSQFAGWALVNLAIALGGAWFTQRRRQRLGSEALAPQTLAKEARSLRRLLVVNGVLDVGYMLGGLTLWVRPQSSPRMKGVGLGILLQGAFLFFFDWIHVGLLNGTSRKE